MKSKRASKVGTVLVQVGRKDAQLPTQESPLNLNQILVPIDFSECSKQALRYAVPLARQLDGKISLLHVVDWLIAPAALSAVVTEENRIEEAAQRKLDELARANVPPELLGSTLVRTGRAYRVITHAARGLRMDLIVIATQGRTGLKRALLGSTAERVVRHAACPVLTIRSNTEAKSPSTKSRSLARCINRILVPMDFSPRSRVAVRFAVGLAQTMKARIGLLHVVQPLPINSAKYRAEVIQCDAEAKLEARRTLKALAALVPEGIKTEELLRQDVRYRGITDAAREWKCDLIVLPTRGRSDFEYIVLGSTAGRVVRHAPCPVLVVR